MTNQLHEADFFFNKPSFVKLRKKHVMNNFRSQRKSEKKEWDECLLVEKAVLNKSNCLKMKIDLNYIQRFSSYLAVNKILCYKNNRLMLRREMFVTEIQREYRNFVCYV